MSAHESNIPQPIDALPQGAENGGEGGHEENVVRLSTTVWLTIASIITMAVVHFALLGGLKWAEQERKAMTAANPPVFPGREAMTPEQFPSPRLEKDYDEEINQVLPEQKALTENYAWVDEKAGIARIPVDRAIDILAEKGLPKVAAPAPTPGAPPNTFVPNAGLRQMAPPAVGSTSEYPAKVDAPPYILPPGKTAEGTTPKPGEPALPAGENKASGEPRAKSSGESKPAGEPKAKPAAESKPAPESKPAAEKARPAAKSKPSSEPKKKES